MAVKAELNLDRLPPEVVERIIQYVDLDTIKSLRLTSRVLGERCLGPRFKSFLKRQTTDLTKRSLQSLCALASHPTLRPVVKNLTIMATVYDTFEVQRILCIKKRRVVKRGLKGQIYQTRYLPCTEQELSTAQSDLAWLRAQQEEREALSDESVIESLASALRLFGRLNSVDLDATVIQGPNVTVWTKEGDWHPIFMRASQVYCLTMSAVARSGVAVDTLTVYRNTPRCSVPSCDITAHVEKLDADQLAVAGASIKNLALSISMRIETDIGKIAAARELRERLFHSELGFQSSLLGTSDPETLAEENFPGIARLLRFIPNLETIDLHLYDTLGGIPEVCDRIFKAIAQETRLPALEQCCLRGIYASTESMLQFLENHPRIKHLDLRQVTLTSGSWEPIFEYLGSSRMPALTRLYLSGLYQNVSNYPWLVNLKPVWEEGSDGGKDDYQRLRLTTFLCLGGSRFVHTREFDADEIKRGLEIQPVIDRHLLGAPYYRWEFSRREEYGPP